MVKLCDAGACRPAISNSPSAVADAGLYTLTCSTPNARRPAGAQVALAPCVDSATPRSATRLAAQPAAQAATKPYRRLDRAELPVPPYRRSRRKRGAPGSFADLYATPAREAELIAIFKEHPALKRTSGKWAGVPVRKRRGSVHVDATIMISKCSAKDHLDST